MWLCQVLSLLLTLSIEVAKKHKLHLTKFQKMKNQNDIIVMGLNAKFFIFVEFIKYLILQFLTLFFSWEWEKKIMMFILYNFIHWVENGQSQSLSYMIKLIYHATLTSKSPLIIQQFANLHQTFVFHYRLVSDFCHHLEPTRTDQWKRYLLDTSSGYHVWCHEIELKFDVIAGHKRYFHGKEILSFHL